DSRASDSYNQALSQRRVDAVKSVLITEFGITPDRLSAVGYGESKPRASNDTVEGRQLNRRVVAIVEERPSN
ncbi:OmpA family protein, partial [Brevibacterium sp. SIMBA_078]|uniref:OmpA family protein n=1 Tax=Brevibacterium sp. SIMBA_078 TaxID=3085816 RepID=UPI00397B45CB